MILQLLENGLQQKQGLRDKTVVYYEENFYITDKTHRRIIMADPTTGGIKSNRMIAAQGMGEITSNEKMALAEIDMATIKAAAIEAKTNAQQRMLEVGMDSLNTLTKIKNAKELQKKIKKGFKYYMEKTGHKLDYDKVTIKDVLNDPSLFWKIGDITITDKVTGAEFTPGIMAGFADIEMQEMFDAFAESGNTKIFEGIAKDIEYGVEYEPSSFGSDFTLEEAKKPEVQEFMGKKLYRQYGLSHWAPTSQIKVMKDYANAIGAVYEDGVVKLKNKEELTLKDFKQGNKVGWKDIRIALADAESSGDPNAVGTNNQEAGVYKYIDKDGNHTMDSGGGMNRINPYYGTQDIGLYGINEKFIRTEDWQVKIDGEVLTLTTNKYSSIDGKPDTTYAEIQSYYDLSSPGTRKENVYQKGGIWRGIMDKIGYKPTKEERVTSEGVLERLNEKFQDLGNKMSSSYSEDKFVTQRREKRDERNRKRRYEQESKDIYGFNPLTPFEEWEY